jgi:RNA polymerase sigma-70 factor (ECF subfamily)
MCPLLNDDQHLIDRIKTGDEEALQKLIATHSPRLFRVIQRVVVDNAEAEVILQETFWKFWQSLSKYQNDRPVYPYLVTIAVNLVRDQWRAGQRLADEDLTGEAVQVADSAPLPEYQVEQAELLQALAEAVADLPESYRMAIALRYDASLSYEEIAEILKININTVRTHLRRSKEILRARIEETYG